MKTQQPVLVRKCGKRTGKRIRTPEELDTLIETGEYDIDSSDCYGVTPMFTATAFNNVKLVKRLLFHGADPNLKTTTGYFPFAMIRSKEMFDVYQNSGFDHSKCTKLFPQAKAIVEHLL